MTINNSERVASIGLALTMGQIDALDNAVEEAHKAGERKANRSSIARRIFAAEFAARDARKAK